MLIIVGILVASFLISTLALILSLSFDMAEAMFAGLLITVFVALMMFCIHLAILRYQALSNLALM